MLKEWEYEIGTGIIKIEEVIHNNEIRYKVNVYDKNENCLDEILVNETGLAKIRDVFDIVINLEKDQ